jgi:hypothetical protein
MPRQQAGKMTAPDRSSNQPNFTLAEQGPSKDDHAVAQGRIAAVVVALPW